MTKRRAVVVAGVVLAGALVGWGACDLYAHMFDWGETLATPLCVKGALVGAAVGAVVATGFGMGRGRDQ